MWKVVLRTVGLKQEIMSVFVQLYSIYYVTGFAKKGLPCSITNIEKSCFDIHVLNPVYLENAWMAGYVLIYQILYILGMHGWLGTF